jgi:hypothetical protein
MAISLTRHAQKRRKQRGLTEHVIEAVLTDPEIVYPSTPTCTCYRRGDLYVIFDHTTERIVTVWQRGEEAS